MTLLEMVQDILNSMDSDNVNSITDTIESTQVADTLKTVYYNLLVHRDWEHLKTLTTLEQVGDTTQPTRIKIPDNVYRIESLKYNTRISTDTTDKYVELIYMLPQDFLNLCLGRNSADSNVLTTTTENSIKLYIINDRIPTYWTSFDNKYIYFDSYHSTTDTTIQASKSLIYAIREPVWTASNTFVPDMPSQLFPLLLETARKTCAKRFRQLTDEEAEKESYKQYNLMRYNQYRTGGGIKYHNWGMKRRK